MIDVAVNTFVMSRGMSGSKRSLGFVIDALRESGDLHVQELPGPVRRGTRVERLTSWAWWDLCGVHRSIPRPAVLVSGCNVGVATARHPNVLLMHDTMVLDHPRDFDPAYVAYARSTFGVSARRSTVVVTPSRDAAARVAERFDLGRMPEVVPWPLVRQAHVPSAEELESRLARPLITVVGATERHKCHEVAVLAARLVRQTTGLPIELSIVGRPGGADAELEHLIATFDGERRWIKRVHWLPDDELAQQYESSWLVLQPSRDEGFGLPVLEACGRGVPVLHTGQGGLSEVHPEGSVGSGAPEAFAARALALLDPVSYERACVAATDSARRHDWPTFVLRWRSVVAQAWSAR